MGITIGNQSSRQMMMDPMIVSNLHSGLRNVDNIHLTVYRADDIKREHPLLKKAMRARKSDYGYDLSIVARSLCDSRQGQ